MAGLAGMYQLAASQAQKVLTRPSSRASDEGASRARRAAAYSSRRLGVRSAMAILPRCFARLPSLSLCQAFDTVPMGAWAM